MPELTFLLLWMLSLQVSLLLKDSFIDSFPGRDRPFIKVCVSLELLSLLNLLYIWKTLSRFGSSVRLICALFSTDSLLFKEKLCSLKEFQKVLAWNSCSIISFWWSYSRPEGRRWDIDPVLKLINPNFFLTTLMDHLEHIPKYDPTNLSIQSNLFWDHPELTQPKQAICHFRAWWLIMACSVWLSAVVCRHTDVLGFVRLSVSNLWAWELITFRKW